MSHCSSQGWSYSLCASGSCFCSSCMTCANHDSGRSCGALADAGSEALTSHDTDVLILVKAEIGVNASSSAGSTPACMSHCSSQGWSYSLCASGSCFCSSCMTCANHDSGRACGALADAGSEALTADDRDVLTLVKAEIGVNASSGASS